MSSARLHLTPMNVTAIVVGVAVFGLLVRGFLNSNTERTAYVQTVALMAPQTAPSPPPPETKKIEDEQSQKLSPRELSDLDVGVAGANPGPATGSSSGLPATGPLGINDAGVGGTDAFGLAARRGGRELLFTSAGGGGGNPAARYLQFAGVLQSHIEQQLNQFPELRKSCYSVQVQVRVAIDGSIGDVKIRSSSGEAALDSRIRDVLLRLAPMPAAPPSDMPWPVGLKIVSRRADCTPLGPSGAG